MNDRIGTAIGTVFIAVLGVLGYYAARSAVEDKTRRFVLVNIATYLLLVVVVRILLQQDILTQIAARIVNGWLAAVFAAALVESLVITPLVVRRLRQ